MNTLNPFFSTYFLKSYSNAQQHVAIMAINLLFLWPNFSKTAGKHFFTFTPFFVILQPLFLKNPRRPSRRDFVGAGAACQACGVGAGVVGGVSGKKWGQHVSYQWGLYTSPTLFVGLFSPLPVQPGTEPGQ